MRYDIIELLPDLHSLHTRTDHIHYTIHHFHLGTWGAFIKALYLFFMQVFHAPFKSLQKVAIRNNETGVQPGGGGKMGSHPERLIKGVPIAKNKLG